MSAAALLLAAALFAADAPKTAPKAAKPSFASVFEAFQKDPSDANREAVITAARAAKKPEPPDAEKFEGRAEYAFKNATDAAGFAAAAAEYRKAVDAAPWSAPNYFNQGVAEEKAGNLAGAKKAFEWYLKADPAATDAKDTRKRIAGLEMGIEQANSPEAKEKAFWAKLEGARFFQHQVGPGGGSWDEIHEIRDRRMTLSIVIYSLGGALAIYDHSSPGQYVVTTMAFQNGAFERGDGTFEYRYTISEDGKTLTRVSRLPGGSYSYPQEFPRQ